jgi:mono/diheme cytochrome c family protein
MTMFAAIKHMAVFIFVMTFLFASFLWAHEKKHETKVKKSGDHHWAAPSHAIDRINPVTDVAASSILGRSLYMENCASCHGAKADGNGPEAEYLETRPTDLQVMAGHHADGDLAWKIENGNDDMPSWKDILTEQQIWHLVNFIQSLKDKN